MQVAGYTSQVAIIIIIITITITITIMIIIITIIAGITANLGNIYTLMHL